VNDEIFLISNAHIDLSWLWTRDETIHEICPKTFTSVLNLMEKYPLLCYAQSAAQIYEWMEQYYPKIFEKIKNKIHEGRWEVVGGSWVEHNANLPCGESLVRQYLFGKRYFMKKFGVDVKVAWLPDTFGFCWTLPQILKKCGIDYFVTHKLKWQIERNKPPIPFPYHIFWWEAPDGSKVLAYHTVGGYSESIEPERLLKQLEELKKKHGISKLLVLFGKGDHGGGPTEEMIERALKLMRKQDFPLIFFSTTKEWFNQIRQLAERIRIPVIRDELYVKTHRGTYTTEAKVKLNNRKCESLLLTAERFATIAMKFGMKYPQQELNVAWKNLLLNQVHDNLDGTSIEEVYIQADKDYKEVYEVGNKVLQEALKTIASCIDTRGEGISLIVFNPLPWKRTDVVKVNIEELGYKDIKIIDIAGQEVPIQLAKEDNKEVVIFIAEDVPGLGYKEYKVIPLKEHSKSKQRHTDLHVNEYSLENRYFHVELSKDSGCITSIYDKVNRVEVLDESNRGNVIQIYDDRPPNAPGGEPAWNLYLSRLIELNKSDKIEIVEKGPVRASIKIVKSYGNSSFTQYIILYRDIPRIDFVLQAYWREKYKTAKIAFPLSFENYWATYEIPFGVIQRYQYSLTSPPPKEMEMPNRKWEPADMAKFEVPALYWINMDREDKRYGVGLLNDCKYGFDVKGNLLRMTILRGPRRGYPRVPKREQWADQSDNPRVGLHVIHYALYPHKGDWRESEIVKKGHEFNYPLIAWIEPPHNGDLPKVYSFMEIKPNNVILSALKKAEDSDDIIIRIYEGHGIDTQASIKLFFKPRKAIKTDLIEWDRYVPREELDIKENEIKLRIRHNEIVTIKLS